MKILLLSNMYPTKEKPQFGIFVYNQIKKLEDKGFSFKIISLKPKGNKIFRYCIFFIKALVKVLFGRKYKIVHVHYVFPPGIFGLIHKKLYKSKLIITIHGSDINKMPKKHLIIKKSIKRILIEADEIIVVSKNIKQKIEEEYEIKEKKIHVINMGVDQNIFKPISKKYVREKLMLSKDKKIILFVGNYYKAKGILDLINAYKIIRNESTQLYLIGDSSVELETTKQINKEMISFKDIFLLNPMSQNNINVWLNACNCFALPSYTEGFNLATLEAMSTGTLVVGTDIPGLSHLKEANQLVVRKGDIKQLAEALQKTLYNDLLDKRKSAMAIAKKYSSYSSANKIAQIYIKNNH